MTPLCLGHSFAALTLTSFFVLGCGGQSDGKAQGDSGGGSTGGSGAVTSGGQSAAGGTNGDASGGTSSGGTSSGGTSSGGMSSGGMSSGGPTCAEENFADDPGWSVAVSIANHTAQTLHLGQAMLTCGVSPLFHVEDATGATLAELGDCRQPCQVVVRGGPTGCPALCRYPGAVTLAPGENTNLIWSGLFRATQVVPVQCLPAGLNQEPLQCDRGQQIEPGQFRFVAQAGSSLDCSSTLGDCPACEKDGRGGCTTAAALIAGKMLSAETSVHLDEGYGVGRGGGGYEMPVPVEIIFKD